jgi:hypothetical protein
MTIDISGTKLLESLENVNPDGSLAKMLKALLTSTTAWYSDRCKLTWKKKVSKSNVLLFQLQASVLGIKEKESGSLERMWRTPTAEGDAGRRGLGKMTTLEAQQKNRTVTLTRQMRDVNQGIIKSPSMFPTPRASAAMTEDMEMIAKRNKYNSKLEEKVALQMYPTPTASDIEGGVSKDVQLKDGHFFRENKKGERWGVKLRDAVSIIPMKKKPGGKLNPEFVEFLMGYPLNWTKIETTE